MKVTMTLGFLGLIPFFTSFYFSIQSLTWQLESKQIFITYSAIILSFIAGTLWDRSEQKKYDKQKVISNIFSLFAFIALLVNDYLALIVLAISYLAIFLYETGVTIFSTTIRVTPAYQRVRLQLTITVIALHITALTLW